MEHTIDRCVVIGVGYIPKGSFEICGPALFPSPSPGLNVVRVKLVEKWRYLIKRTFSVRTFNGI